MTLAAAGRAIAGVLGAARSWLGGGDRAAAVEETTPLTPRRLTLGPDSYGSPAMSPDGGAVAYVSDRTGTQEIVVAGLAAGSREIPITTDGGGNIEPAFSPDGQWLAYHSRKSAGIWVVPSTGGTPRQVADFGSDPSWSPDSQTIVFTSHGGGLSSQAVLWTVHRDGASPVQLTRLGNPPGGHLSPEWSHNGRLIAFMVGRHEERETWIMKAGGGTRRRLATVARDSAPRFSPDDRAVYWIDKTAEGNDCLTQVKLSREGEAHGEPEVVLPFHGEGVGHPSIARNGTAVFLWNRLSVNLFALDIGAGGAPRQITFDREAVSYPSWSQDGKWLSVNIKRGDDTQVGVVSAEGGPVEQLTYGRGIRWPYSSSPDGDRIAFAGGLEGNAVWNIYTVSRSTKEVRQLTQFTTTGGARFPAWSPRGNRIVFVSPKHARSLWTMRLPS